MEFDDISKRVMGCAIEVYGRLGPGLLESAYEPCLARELNRNVSVATGFHTIFSVSFSDFFALFVSFVVAPHRWRRLRASAGGHVAIATPATVANKAVNPSGYIFGGSSVKLVNRFSVTRRRS